jgi:DNA repair photolyase
VKPDAPAQLAAALAKKSWKRELIVFSGNTDPYQPVEAAWKLTRRCLEVCAEHRNPVGIITKSQLVRRDEDVLSHLAESAGVRVFLSIPFLDEEIARKMEPGAPTVRRRFETVRILAEAGIPVGVSVAPVIPGLNDADIPGILQEAKRCGAGSAFYALLRLPGSVKDVFLQRLHEQLPLRAARVEQRIRDARGGELNRSAFGERQRGEGRYWESVRDLWELWIRKLELQKRGTGDAGPPGNPAPDPPTAPPPPRGPRTQMELSL